MTNVQSIAIPPEYQELWDKSAVVRAGYWGEKVDRKFITWRKRNFTSLIARGSFQNVASLWDSLTLAQQGDWDDAGYYAGVSGWDLFVQDTLYRISNGIQGLATPNLYHQFKVGKLLIESPAESAKISQLYETSYPAQYYFDMCLFADLTSTGAGSYAVVRFLVYFYDDSYDPPVWWWDDEFEYDISAMAGWDMFGDSFGLGDASVRYIKIEIEVYKMRGVVYFDDIEIIVDDVNWGRDWQCDFVQLNWDKPSLPVGSTLLSVYPPDNI